MMGRKAVCIRWTSSASQHLWSAENMGKRKVNDPTTELSGVNNLNWKNKHEANSQQKNGTSVIGVRLIVNDVYRDLSPLASKCCIQFDPALASLLFLLFLMHSFSHVGSLCIFQSLLEESLHFFFQSPSPFLLKLDVLREILWDSLPLSLRFFEVFRRRFFYF